MAEMTGRQAIMDIFQAQAVEFIFGNPGTTELGLLDILQDYPQIQYVMSLHESVALGMAHMYAAASGKTGVVNLHVAPGLGNALGALYNALVGKSPLIVTAGQQDSRMLAREPILSHDLVSMAKPLTKWAVQLQHAEEIPVIIPRAFKVAHDPPRGPVFIALPSNVIDQQADLAIPTAHILYRRSRPDPDGISAAASLLSQAVNPVIICGDGVAASQALDELVHLSEAIGAQVWNTVLMGALNFPITHAQFRGELPAEYPAIQRALGEADVVLAVGADLFDEVFYADGPPLPDGCKLIQIDNSCWEIGKNLPASVGLLADPKLALQELTEVLLPKLTRQAQDAAAKRCDALGKEKKLAQQRQKKRAQEKWHQSPIATARLMATLSACLPADVVVYNESITAGSDLIRSLQLSLPGSLFGNHGGGIGQGLPGALGIKLANPKRPVVAIIGDGSAMYTVQSFWTAAHHHIAVVYVILNNQSYRILKYNMNRYRRSVGAPPGRVYPAMDLTQPELDFIEIAHGMGITGRRVTQPDDIQAAVEQALASNAPYVIDVLTDGTVSSS